MLFPAKVGQEIRPMNKLSDKRIDLKTHGKVRWVKGRGRERGNTCSFVRTLP